jgi:uncharacterized protein (DUF2384 family)
MKIKSLDFFSRLRRASIPNTNTQEEMRRDAEAMPVLTHEDQERIARGGRVTVLAEQLVTSGNTYDFLFKPHKMEDIYAPAVVEARQRCLDELIEHARAYAACPQRPPGKDKGDFEPEI